MRKPVAAYATASASHGNVVLEYVICDDGSVWWRNVGDWDWEEDNPIPGTRREEELKEENAA
jgi:hypothetical protein